MSKRELNMFKGITIPVKAEEGKIDIVTTHSVVGNERKPVLQYPLVPGDAVELSGELLVKKATGNNPVIGFVHDNPEFVDGYEPAQNYTAAQAKSAGVLRELGVESIFKAVRTVPAKASNGITAGMYVEFSTDGFKQTSSSGTTASGYIALTNQTTDNKVVVGIL